MLTPQVALLVAEHGRRLVALGLAPLGDVPLVAPAGAHVEPYRIHEGLHLLGHGLHLGLELVRDRVEAQAEQENDEVESSLYGLVPPGSEIGLLDDPVGNGVLVQLPADRSDVLVPDDGDVPRLGVLPQTVDQVVLEHGASDDAQHS